MRLFNGVDPDAPYEERSRQWLAWIMEGEVDVIQLPDHSQRGHSPLGASGAERWIECPGSVELIRNLALPETDEPDYRREGTAMHEAAAHCLTHGLDTWEIVGQTFNQTEIDGPMADAIQVYVDYCRGVADSSQASWIEFPVSSPVHKNFYGTLDFGAVVGQRVHVVDLKGGEGIIVDPDDNPQLKYYAFGLLDAHPEWNDEYGVDLAIVQPRAYTADGQAVRAWSTTAGAIREWVHDTLVPAMLRTEMDSTLEAGSWCRFCPAKLVCPLLTSLYRAAATCNPKDVVSMDADVLGQNYRLRDGVKFYLKALEDETLRRLQVGDAVTGTKLVRKKSNRVFTEAGVNLAVERFGQDAYAPTELKTPAQLEKLSPAAKTFVQEFSYMPEGGVTVALEEDPKMAVTVQKASDAFKEAVAALDSPSGSA